MRGGGGASAGAGQAGGTGGDPGMPGSFPYSACAGGRHRLARRRGRQPGVLSSSPRPDMAEWPNSPARMPEGHTYIWGAPGLGVGAARRSTQAPAIGKWRYAPATARPHCSSASA